jgi:secondary thiamine-phosphate synthase enzyme
VTTARHPLRITTERRTQTIDITDRVAAAVEGSRIDRGICVVSVEHTTAAVFVNENADPDVRRDLLAALERLVPDDGDYRHAEGNGPAHIKSVLVGCDVTVPVRGGTLDLGRWQGIFFAEFDGPRDRHAAVTIIGDDAG